MHMLRLLHQLRHMHRVWHLVLVVMVLWGQAAALHHRLSHTQPRTDGDAVHSTCLECLALHAVDHAGPAAEHAFALPPKTPRAAPAQAAATAPTLQRVWAYHSRAPPLTSA